MRFLQGIAVGGEWGGAVLMAVEHAPAGKKGFFGSLPQVGVAPGLILSSLAMGSVASLPEKDMLSWGWRIPFLASVVLLLVGWFIRVKVAESPDFENRLFRVFSGCPADPCAIMQFLWDRYRPLRSLA